jgi:hypothetical protein
MTKNEDSKIASSLSDVVVASSKASQGVSEKTNQASQHLGKQRQYWRDIILGVSHSRKSIIL